MIKLKFFCLLLAISTTVSMAEEPSRVVLVHDAAAVKSFEPDAGRIAEMVSHGVQQLTGKSPAAAAWSSLVSKLDVVGIKINTDAAPLHFTRKEVVDAIAAGLGAAGVASTNIIVWDRTRRQLQAAGYETTERYQVQAVIEESGWDATQYYDAPIVGKLIWGDLLYGDDEEGLNTRSHFAKLITQQLTKIINVPALQDNESYGIAGCLANLSIGAVDNQRRFGFGSLRGDPDIPTIFKRPEIHDKVVLHVMDALIAGFAGGPVFKPKYSWAPATLYFSRDPVAIDALCVALLEKKRAAANVPPIEQRAAHITTAGQMGLGEANREKIQVITAP